MNEKTVCNGILCFLTHHGFGQDAGLIVNYNPELTRNRSSLRNTRLFNAEEIKANKISSCMIVHPFKYLEQ